MDPQDSKLTIFYDPDKVIENDEISSHRSYESNENEAVRSIQKSLISEYNKS